MNYAQESLKHTEISSERETAAQPLIPARQHPTFSKLFPYRLWLLQRTGRKLHDLFLLWMFILQRRGKFAHKHTVAVITQRKWSDPTATRQKAQFSSETRRKDSGVTSLTAKEKLSSDLLENKVIHLNLCSSLKSNLPHWHVYSWTENCETTQTINESEVQESSRTSHKMAAACF